MLVVLVSTTGDSPLTVSSSETEAIWSCVSSVTVVLRLTRMPSRRTLLNPATA